MTHIHSREELPAPATEEVAPGVFAFIQPDGSWGLNNTGFVTAADHVVAIDTCFTERRTRGLIEAIRGRAGERQVRTLVNTHHHGDHTFGNFLFPNTTIIGHDLCREMVLREGFAAHRLFGGVEWGDIVVAPPSVTFSDRLELWAGDTRVELIFVGPAHTTNDIVAWLPDQRVLFTGDVVFNGGMPFALAGSIWGWLDAVDVIRRLAPATIVPGHGPVCGPAVLDDIEAYLRLVLDAAKRGFDAGAAPLEVARGLDLGRFGDWLDGERLAANIHRAYSELRGEPRGVPLGPEAITDMIALNGGQPPRCLA